MNDLFLGPMLVRTVHRPEAPLPEDLADRIIAALLQGLAPRSPKAQVTAVEPTSAPV